MKKKNAVITVMIILALAFSLYSVDIFAAANPYTEIEFVEAQEFDWDTEGYNEFHQDLIKFEGTEEAGTNVGGTYDGAWLEYDSYDFGTVGAVSVNVNYCNNSGRCSEDSTMEIWIDGYDEGSGGTKMGTINLEPTGGNWDSYEDTNGKLDAVITGTHTVYVVLRGTTSSTNPFIANLRTFEFVKGEGEEKTPEPGTDTSTPTAEPTDTPTEEPTATQTNMPVQTTARATSTNTASTDVEEGEENSSTLIIVIVIVAAVVIVAGVAAGIYLKKKKG